MIGVKWEAPDGSLWDLRDGSDGIQLGQGGLTGLRHPPAKVYTRESSFVDGQQVTGFKLGPRPIDLPLDIHGHTEAEWFVRDRSIMNTFRIGRYGKLIITDPLGGTRTITARLADSDDDGMDDDPTVAMGSTVVVPLIADDPWYYGRPIPHLFKNADPNRSFYGPTGYGPPFYLAPEAFTGADTLTNPGDAPAWGVLTVEGPCAGFRVNINGRVIEGFAGGVELPAGRTMTLDTDPRRSSARLDDGTNVMRYLTSTQFAAVPDGSSVPVEVIVYGGTATLTLTPRYLRGW